MRLSTCFPLVVISSILMIVAVSVVGSFIRLPLRNWTLHSLPQIARIKASVPGHALLDVIRADPYWEFGEIRLSPLSLVTWTYETRIDSNVREGEVAQLYFEGHDTVASVFVNHSSLLTKNGLRIVDNAFLPHIFLLPKSTSPAQVLLEVTIQSSLKVARERANSTFADKVYPHTVNYHVWSEPTHRNTLRKPASDFGWDWGPSFPVAGITGDVFLEKGPTGWAILDGVNVKQEFVDDGSVRVNVSVRVRRLSGTAKSSQPIRIQFGPFSVISDHLGPNDTTKSYTFHLVKPKLWHPRGSRRFDGAPHLYALNIHLSETDVIKRKIGLRRVSLGSPESFALSINGEIIDCHGTNMIPFDAFSTRVRWADMASTILRTASELHTNIFRVWGGGYLPTREFYEACDEQGFLVWQDLPWACAVFPASGSFLSAAQEETRHIVSTLQSHPSVVVWGGNNEVEASFEWFPETMRNRQAYERDYVKLFVDTIGVTVHEYGGNTALYVDSSPSNGLFANGTKRWGDVTNPSLGDIHFYNYAMNCEDEDEYPKALFVSEHGVQSFPSTLTRYSSRPVLESVLDSRQRHEHGFDELQKQAARMFSSSNLSLQHIPYEQRALLTQIMQGRCLTSAISAWRSYQDNHGIVLWQLNDVWPGVSWSLLEYDLSWKYSAYAVQKAFDPVRFRLQRHRDTGDVVVTVQSTSALLGKTVFGHVLLSEFSWPVSGDDGRSLNLLFRVHLTKNMHEVGRFAADGVKMTGIGFIDSDTRTTAFIIEDWIEPCERFRHFVPSKATGDVITWSVLTCDVSVTNVGDWALPYVWLNVGDLAQHGKFSHNGFLLLPRETKQVRFECFKKLIPSVMCNKLASALQISSLSDALHLIPQEEARRMPVQLGVL